MSNLNVWTCHFNTLIWQETIIILCLNIYIYSIILSYNTDIRFTNTLNLIISLFILNKQYIRQINSSTGT